MDNNRKAHLTVRLTAGQATPGSISKTLAPLGIDLQGFCSDFNLKSLEYTNDKEIEINTLVVIDLKTKKYQLSFRGISISFLLKIAIESKEEDDELEILTLLDLYKIVLIQNVFLDIDLRSLTRQTFASLNTIEDLLLESVDT